MTWVPCGDPDLINRWILSQTVDQLAEHIENGVDLDRPPMWLVSRMFTPPGVRPLPPPDPDYFEPVRR